ncbi:hypothetical protein Tco_0934788 [Tanacetum coccineum]
MGKKGINGYVYSTLINPKEYEGKGGAIVYTRWIEKMESVHDMSGCRDSQRVKYFVGSFVGKALTWWNSEIRIRGREAAVVSLGVKLLFPPHKCELLLHLIPMNAILSNPSSSNSNFEPIAYIDALSKQPLTPCTPCEIIDLRLLTEIMIKFLTKT